MKNKLVIITGALATIIFLIIIFYPETNLGKEITTELEICSKNGKGKVNFNKIKGDFDSLLILESYTNTTKLITNLGIDVKNTGINSRDDINLIVLLKKRNVKDIIYINKDYYMSKVNPYRIFPRNHEFTLEPQGGITLILE